MSIDRLIDCKIQNKMNQNNFQTTDARLTGPYPAICPPILWLGNLLNLDRHKSLNAFGYPTLHF